MKNLILVNQGNKQNRSDFDEICGCISRLCDDVVPYVVDTKQGEWELASEVSENPTMTVSYLPIRRFSSPRGPVFEGCEVPKSDQYRRLRNDGISVPDWQTIEPGDVFGPEQWGPYVVVKPELGRCGREIKVKRTERVRYRSMDSFPDDNAASRAPMLVQRFIYTGPWASSYRVVTLFGKALMSWYCEMDHDLPPLKSRFGFADQGGINIVSNKRSSTYSLSFEPDVIALAEAAHKSFPGQPLLGHDVARDHETGELFILECNPRGDTWLFSSYTGVEIQKAHHINFYTQWDGLTEAARALIQHTREHAS